LAKGLALAVWRGGGHWFFGEEIDIGNFIHYWHFGEEIDIDILKQGGMLGSGSPETRHIEAEQHELRPDLRGLVGMILGLANP